MTNLHLIHIKKGFWGGTKDKEIIPVNLIKVFDGKPQVTVTKASGIKQLEVYHSGGYLKAVFSNQKDTDKWANNLIKLLNGNTSDFDRLGDSSLFGVDVVAETLKDTFDTFKAGLGIKDAEPEKISTKCGFCGAPLSGFEKQTVICPYCDMEQGL